MSHKASYIKRIAIETTTKNPVPEKRQILFAAPSLKYITHLLWVRVGGSPQSSWIAKALK